MIKMTFETDITWYSHKEFAPAEDGQRYLVVTMSGWITTLEYDAKHDAFSWSDVYQEGIEVLYWAEIPSSLTENAKILKESLCSQ